jgi:hypothetical protein
MLSTLHGALQSRNPETLRQVEVIADERLKSRVSKLAGQAFTQVSTDAKRMIEELSSIKK